MSYASRLSDQSLDWMIVGRQGGMTRRDVSLHQIQSLTLTESPAGEQLARIRELIGGLSSDDYRTRQQSEDELRVAGRRFQKVSNAGTEAVARPRVRLAAQPCPATRSTRVDEAERNELDRIVLSDGSVLLGDAGDFSLIGQWRGDVDHDRA